LVPTDINSSAAHVIKKPFLTFFVGIACSVTLEN
jgi:hypothetical protein